jgi:hypothetical protein
MNAPPLDTTLRELGVIEYIERADQAALARVIASAPTKDTDQPVPERLPRLGFLYETKGISAYQRWVTRRGEEELRDVHQNFLKAFASWRALISLPNGAYTDFSNGHISAAGIDLIRSELPDEPIPTELALAFHLAVTGLLGNRVAETRLELGRFALPYPLTSTKWYEQVAGNICSAFALLVRKANGWEDILRALESIGKLRQLQQTYEASYLESQSNAADQTTAAIELAGLYHLAQLVTLAGEYLRDGAPSITQVNVRLDRHHEQALTAFRAGQRPLLAHMADLLWVGCRELAQNAIWTHVGSLGEAAKNFAQLLADHARSKPVIELWPSQQQALRRGLLDPYQRAILVEMPTSAGKTLLAQFAIVQTKALNPKGRIAYIVPTRALVNQVTHDLRRDFRELTPLVRVEQAVPAFELDPTEDRFLISDLDVIVSTPEKLDLLVRRRHPAIEDIALVVADEAHNICDETRGPRLELLLGTIKRDHPGARFLLLSPFLPNDEELVLWLGEDRALPPISVDWKPSRRLVGTVDIIRLSSTPTLVFETLPAADNTDVRAGMQLPIGRGIASQTSRTISGLTRATVHSMLEHGSTLILCRGQGTAMTRAEEIAEHLPRLDSTPDRETVCRYLEAEIGHHSSLIEFLQRGVAYHHAGLSHEARWLIEGLVARGQVNVICGTTTLAQGVNFPIATVIVETLKKGNADLTYQDFWNIAGRAGRALMDAIGVVAFPAPNKEKRNEYIQFLQGEAQNTSSQLATLIDRADDIAGQFNLKALRDWPQLSALLQFLAHAMRVSGVSNLAEEVDDVLRASLIYHQARHEGENAVQRLVRLCRSYLEQIRGQPGLLTLSDQTGFATPSVRNLLVQTGDNTEFINPSNWQPERLFSENLQPLRQRVEMIAMLPEIQLGQGNRPPFNAERVAGILRDWVRGETLGELSRKYTVPPQADAEKRVADFSSYLFSQLLARASWGIGALENIALAGDDEAEWEKIGYVPSMIFFGVERKEAVWLRMAGVPRLVADNLGKLWEQKKTADPNTYDDIRRWVTQLSDTDWRQAIPTGTSLTPDDMRHIWREIAG